jgi:hypothetical protein
MLHATESSGNQSQSSIPVGSLTGKVKILKAILVAKTIQAGFKGPAQDEKSQPVRLGIYFGGVKVVRCACS